MAGPLPEPESIRYVQERAKLNRKLPGEDCMGCTDSLPAELLSVRFAKNNVKMNREPFETYGHVCHGRPSC